MTFRRGARLNPGQLRDLRGVGGRGRGLGGIRLGLPGGSGRGRGGGGVGLPMGGGLGSIVLIVVVLLVLFYLSGGLGGAPATSSAPGGSGLAHCQTGQDANEQLDCRIVGFVNSIQAYWTDEYAATGKTYREATTTLFSDSVDTACGAATSASGPFYCPGDENVYIDLGFFDVLTRDFGATAGPLAQAYVVAHEYGHHVQNLAGTLERSQDGTTGPTSSGVRVELQADCYAGVWAANAVDTEYIEPLTESEIATALAAAASVGDDRIQEQSGRVNPETWMHGSSAQRQKWFGIGYRGGDPADCDTFSGAI